ncbi:MAG: hypothetical protein COB04_08040 [Gammaproteobacteria bacterium]|nr:MAG: hypothetical protein COB04_08040 [Gammaproteobacteria bacterium]
MLKITHLPLAKIKLSHYGLSLLLLSVLSQPGFTGDLDLAQQALELRVGSEPNVVILMDDSGSMDWEVMSLDFDNGSLFTGLQPDGSNTGVGPLIDRDSNDDGFINCLVGSGSFFGYLYGVEFGSNTYGDNGSDCNTSDDQAWRFRNADFNPLYFDPAKTYQPWPGLDSNGDAFQNISITAATDNPFASTYGETIDLTQHNSNWFGGTTRTTSDDDSNTIADGFRYYRWRDLNGDSLFDNGEETEFFIADADSATQQNFANWFSYYRSRDMVAKGAITLALENITNVRVGYATINQTAHNIEIAEMNPSPTAGNKKALFDKILGSVVPSSGTPVRQNLEKVGKYYECVTGNIFNTTNCPILPEPAGSCQQNFTILVTDGAYNGGDPSVGNTDSGSGDWDGGAYADNESNTLADVAMHYYETDLQPTINDNVPATAADIAGSNALDDEDDTMHQHMKTFVIGFGVNGSLTGPPDNIDDAFAWPNPYDTGEAKIDDLIHAAYNGRGEYLSASDPAELTNALENVFTTIQSTVGSASAVALNTQSLEQGARVFRAFYNSRTNSGDVVAITIDSQGTIDTTELWSAAEQLDTVIENDARTVIGFKRDGVNTGGIPFVFSDLLSSQQALLNTPAALSLPIGYGNGDTDIGDERMDYLLGDNIHEGDNASIGEFRDREAASGKLGDIIHSSPVFVGTAPFSGRDEAPYPLTDTYSLFATSIESRTTMVYIGANDGMFHGFSADNGSELIAFAPNETLENLSDLTSPSYQHQMYVDLTASVNDAYVINRPLGAREWTTVLMGGYRSGGKGYFALDVTNPSEYTLASTAAETVLWEFGEEDDGGVGNSDVGYSFSQPIIAMSNATLSGEQRWVAIFGNGYNSTSSDGDSALYILFIEEGVDGTWSSGDFIKVTTGHGKAESSDGTTPNGLGSPVVVDADANGTADYVYVGDLQGNLFRFDISSSSSSTWANSSNLKVVYQAEDDLSNPQPIIAQPVVISHPDEDGFIVIAGTGSWMTNDDATTSEIQSIYGIWDDLSNSPEVSKNQLVEQEFTNQSGTIEGYSIRTLSENEIVWKNNGSSSSKVKGWYIDFDVTAAGSGGIEYPGERPTQLSYIAGILFANTIIPKDPSSCEGSPGGFQLAFDPATGGAYPEIVFDLNNDHNYNEDDQKNGASPAALFYDKPLGPSTFISDRVLNSLSDGEIISTGINVTTSAATGRLSWREIDLSTVNQDD